MSKRSRIVRRRMRAHQNWKHCMEVLLRHEIDHAMKSAIRFAVVNGLATKFDNGALGQPVIIEEVEIKSASLDGMSFIYHPRNPNP